MIAAMLSVVIPTLNAAPTIGRALDALTGAAPGAKPGAAIVAEVVVVDGGSVDGTAAAAGGRDARVIEAPAGRGGQLAAGAAAARGDWLLFLHADTVLEPSWQREAAAFIAATGDGHRAAAFRFALDDPRTVARLWEGVVVWRCRLLGLAYGDQGLLISRAFYDRLGGFRPLPLMEDVELVRRIGRRRLALLGTRAVTSAERYRRDGYLNRVARNGLCLGLYLLGVPPRAIQRLYG